jgi:hypothetical protein
MQPLLVAACLGTVVMLAAALPEKPGRAAQLKSLDAMESSRRANTATKYGKSEKELRDLVGGGEFQLNEDSLTAHFACTFGRDYSADSADPLAAAAMVLTASPQSLVAPGLGDPDPSQAFKLHRWAKGGRVSTGPGWLMVRVPLL